MKIAILILGFPPKRLAGTEIATYNSAKHLAQRGHKVHVVTTRDAGLPSYEKRDGFFIRRLTVPRVRVIESILYCVRAFLKVKQIDPDIVHAQAISPAGLSAFLIRKAFKKPYILWGRGFDVYMPWRFKGVISKLVLRNAAVVIALTADMAQEIQKICAVQPIVLPNGIDLERFDNLPSKETLRSRLMIEEGQKIILFVGVLKLVKGVRYLIEAMTTIRQKEPLARLLIVGYGEERQALEELTEGLNLRGQVSFIGRVPNEVVPQYMAASDVFILPSLLASESFGIVNLEAMASGLPIVVSRVRGLGEIVEDGQNGFLIEPRNPEAIAQKVLLLLQDEGLRQRIGERNRQKAKQYSWQEIVAKLEEIYFQCLTGRRE